MGEITSHSHVVFYQEICFELAYVAAGSLQYKRIASIEIRVQAVDGNALASVPKGPNKKC